MFTDAHKPVTLEEGDRYPLGPPVFGAIVYRLGHSPFTRVRRGSIPPSSTILLGVRQEVRQRILIPSCIGSIPIPPARSYRRVLEVVSGQAHNLEVGGSNPSSATKPRAPLPVIHRGWGSHHRKRQVCSAMTIRTLWWSGGNALGENTT